MSGGPYNLPQRSGDPGEQGPYNPPGPTEDSGEQPDRELLRIMSVLKGSDPANDPGFLPEDADAKPFVDWLGNQASKFQAPPMPDPKHDKYGFKGSPEHQQWMTDQAMSLGMMGAPVKITRSGPMAYFSYYPRGSAPENVQGMASVRMPEGDLGAYFNNIYSQTSRGAGEMLDAIKGYLPPDALDNMALLPITAEAIPFWRQVAARIKDQFPNLYTNIRSGIINAVDQTGRSGQEIPSTTKMFSRDLWGG